MKVAIFTEDSGVKLPPIDEYKDKIGRGRHLKVIDELTEILESEGLDIPSDDIELEDEYNKLFDQPIKVNVNIPRH